MALLDFPFTPRIILATSIVAVVGTYLYRKLYYIRFKQSAKLPQLPPSLLFGHLIKFHQLSKNHPADGHPDHVFVDIYNALGRPPVFALNMWPAVPPMVAITDHNVAEQLSRATARFPYSAPKSDSPYRMAEIIGYNSIFLKHDEEWKILRKRFNPGFAPQHLMSLLPVILKKSERYLSTLDHFCVTGEVLSLDYHSTNLTFDVITAVTMAYDADAQRLHPSQQGTIVQTMKQLVKMYDDDKFLLPWWLAPLLFLKRQKLSNKLAAELRPIIHRSFQAKQESQSQKNSRNRDRSILGLSLADIEVLTPAVMEETVDALKTFLFAGYHTTSTTLNYCIYELSRTPHALRAVQQEVEDLFGAETCRDPSAMRNKLIAPGGEDLVHRMKYINAVFKESLRLYPPAASMRMAKPGDNLVVSTSQGEYRLDGHWIYLHHYIIHRDPAVYGESADHFVPERWLKENDDDNELPASAWRVFERGPRNCIGLELANIEIRVMLALLAHTYQFSKVGLGESKLDDDAQLILDKYGQHVTKSDLYMKSEVIGKSADGMMMKVKKR